MKKTTVRFTGAVAGLALVGLTACGGGDSTETENGSDGGPTTIRVANLPVAATMVLTVAAEQGFLEDHGIDAEITESSELATFIPALGNQYDIVMTTPTDFLSAATRGFDIVSTGNGWADGAGLISADAKTIEDLAGKKIATNSLTGLQYAMLEDTLEQHGVEGFELIPVPFAAQPDQLIAGQVDAAVVPEPWVSQLLQDPAYTRVFTPIEEATGQQGTLTGWFSTTREFADDNPEAIEGWQAALTEAIEWIQANEADFRALLERELDLQPDIAAIVTLPGYKPEITADDLGVYLGPLVRQEQLEASAEDLDLSQYVLGG